MKEKSNTKQHSTTVAETAEALFDFAIDREDVMWLLERLPEPEASNRATIAYELQLLKIIITGWSISYFGSNNTAKDTLAEQYWQLVFAFSTSLSETTGLMAGLEVDYFQAVREHLDTYINAMNRDAEASEPAAVIGPEFARFCGAAGDLPTTMTGARLFVSTIGRVSQFLETLPS